MTRPVVRLLSGTTPIEWGVLAAQPAEPHDLGGTVVAGIVSDGRSAAAALDALLRGADLCIRVGLDAGARAAFLDQVTRVADVEDASRELANDEEALLGELRAGAALQEAARRAGMSRRTAARRLAALRHRFGVQTVTELLVATRR
jgi:hypothetical protein